MRAETREWDDSYFGTLMQALWCVLANEPIPDGCWHRMEGSVSGAKCRDREPVPTGDRLTDEVRRIRFLSRRALWLSISNWESNFLLWLGRALDALAESWAVPSWHLEGMAAALEMED